MILEFFPPVVQAVNREIENHPLLSSLLAAHPGADLETRIGIIAAYCNVVVDGYYLEEDLETLFHLLYKILREKSAITIQ